ncbi:MAG TPA: SagB/ThcOx family dehydrogenase, partial [Bacteroidales bacterium]|nr:SagB/ThcOx family dehydrogenase [Bacteroidales bacterium]
NKMKGILIVLAIFLSPTFAQAQELKLIQLLEPDLNRGLNIMQAFKNRASATAFSPEPLSIRDLSDVVWAANGINRPDGRRTAPSARNSQDIDIYVIKESGAFIYNHHTHTLEPIASGDHRGLVVGRQVSMANAPVMLVLVSDISRFPSGDETQRLRFGAMDAGIVSQNIAIACAGLGLATRPRASMDVVGLQNLLKLNENQRLMLNHPIGHPAD